MAISISRYKQGRFWALYDAASTLVCLCVYKKGAQEVQRRLAQQAGQENLPGLCRLPQQEGKELRQDMDEGTMKPGQDGVQMVLPAWTPFARTGQVVTVHLPHMPDGVVWENNRYLVVVRDYGAGSGDAGRLIWLSIKNVDNSARHDWRDLQRIKNELAGPEVEAVELYPAESRMVDNANQFHLWCVTGFRFPFGFEERLVSENTLGVTQRPFAPDMRPADMTAMQVQTGQPAQSDAPYIEPPTTLRLPLKREQRFALGELVMTHDAALALHQARQTGEPYLLRHLAGDWGDLDEDDKTANDHALQAGERLLSCYALPTGAQLWIITEADRASSTILMPDEY